MTKTTIKNVTNAKITALCNEAASSGDHHMVWLCHRAMGEVDSSATAAQRKSIIAAAKREVVAAIRNAEAQQ